MGVIYAAKHSMMGRQAVVKVLLPEMSAQKTIVERFFNEARAAAQIHHPGIVDVFDLGYTDDGQAYIVMERLRGETLSQRIRRGRIGWEHTCLLIRQMSGALAAAHKEGIVHRDLKPDNVFVIPDPDVPGGERIKILDFGIAKIRTTTGSMATMAGAVMGTPPYMAPEQCSDSAAVDHRADMYALGCIMYEMLTQKPPFGFGSLDVIASHLRDPIPPLRTLEPSVPEWLEYLGMTMLAKNPAARLSSCDELSQQLSAQLPRATTAPHPQQSGFAPTMTPPPQFGSQPQFTPAPALGSQPQFTPPPQTGSQPQFPPQPQFTPPPPTAGQPQVTTHTAGAGQMTAPPLDEKRGMGVGVILLAVVLIGAVGGGTFFFLQQKGDDKSASNKVASDAGAVAPAADAAVAVTTVDAATKVTKTPVDAAVVASKTPDAGSKTKPVDDKAKQAAAKKKYLAKAHADGAKLAKAGKCKKLHALRNAAETKYKGSKSGFTKLVATCKKVAAAKHKPKKKYITRYDRNRALDRLAPRITQCADRFGNGSATVKVYVHPNGHVRSVRVTSASSTGHRSCAASIMRRARFPRTQKGGVYTQPLRFLQL